MLTNLQIIDTGVYRLTTPTINDLSYIGSAARSFARRWVVHRSALLKGIHHAPQLQKVVREHGLSVVRFEVLEICTPADCIAREQYWIDQFPVSRRYNVNPLAWSRLGSKLTDAQCQRLIESHGGIGSPEIRSQIVAEYLSGAKQSTLAQKYSVNRGTIRNYLRRSGAEIRLPRTHNQRLCADIVKSYSTGEPITRLTKIHRLDYRTIVRVLLQSGIQPRSNSDRQKLRFRSLDSRRRHSEARGGKRVQFIHRMCGSFTGYPIELAEKFQLRAHAVAALATGRYQAYRGWEITDCAEKHVWKRPEHRQYPRGMEHPMANKIFDLECRRVMARRLRRCSDSQILEIRRLLQSGMRQSQIAKRFQVAQSVISRINTGARHYAEFH